MTPINQASFKDQNHLAEQLLKICQRMSSERNLVALLDLIANEATKLVGADRASLFLLDRERGELWSKVVLGSEEIRFDARLGIAGAVALTGQTINVENVYQDPRFYKEIDLLSGYRTQSLLAVPLRTNNGEIIGTFEVLNKETGAFSKADEEILRALAAQAAISLENARLYEKMQQEITQRKLADELLRQAKSDLVKANADLERRVQERTADLKQANAALLRNIEEQKKLEEQLRHAQKMESIGRLAGGIAHEFNNILNIIQGYASLIRLEPSAGRVMDESLKIIDQQIKRAVSLVRQLLTVARRTATHLEPVYANDLVLAISELVKQSFPKTIEVALNLDPGLPPVMADSNQLSQAILNICVNARDAMPVGGKLTVRTEKIDENKLRALHLESSAESYVSFVISDTGMGMDGEVRARIFEPFFTTKGVGEGTGLGLAIVYGIVKEHNGFIEVESAPGLGTTLRIYLPVVRSEGKSAVNELLTEESASRKYASGRGTVLVVEDEEAMVHLLIEALSRAGYQTLTAMNGEEAVDLYHQHTAEIDIVVLDLGLPKVSGFDVIHKLMEQRPSVSIIITTGYLQPDLKPELFQAGVKDCIYKPYVVDDLVEKVGFLIEHSRTSSYQKTLVPPQPRAV
jgi:signal transduction histidine kinase/ActR/RegA family two-component response regulator